LFPKKFWDKIKKNNIPLEVGFELTWRCNQRCLFCYQYPPGKDELSTKEVKNIIDQLSACGALFISFTGGEPLLREDFWQIAGYARDRNFALQLQTNGTLIDKSAAKKLKRLNFYAVNISLLGASAKTHDLLAGLKGSFKSVLKAIEYLKKENVRVELRTTITRENFNERKDIENLADDLGVKVYFSSIIYPRADGKKTPLKHRISDTQLKNFYNYVFSGKTRRNIAIKAKNTATPFLLCLLGRTCCAINARGEVNPCGAVPLNMGSLRENSFSEIWQNADLLKKIRYATKEDLKECLGCNLSPFCMRCSGLSFSEKGDIFSSSTESCRMAKTMKEVILR